MLETVNILSRRLSCTFIPGTISGVDPVPEIYNSTYTYWRNTWADFFAKAGCPSSALNIENFLRHQFTVVLHRDQEIVGSVSSSFFNVGALSTYDHPGIAMFPAEIHEKMRASGFGLCMTGEYLSVTPEYRKEIVGISLADVLCGLVLKVFVQQQAKFAVASTVRWVKVHSILKKFGYSEVGSFKKIGVDCVLLYTTKENFHEHPDPKVANLINRFWENRVDLTHLTNNKNTGRQAA